MSSLSCEISELFAKKNTNKKDWRGLHQKITIIKRSEKRKSPHSQMFRNKLFIETEIKKKKRQRKNPQKKKP